MNRRFYTKISDNRLKPKTAKTVRRLLLVSGLAFMVVSSVLFLPIPIDLTARLFAEMSIITIAAIIGTSTFIILYLILEFGGSKYKKAVLIFKDNSLEFKQRSESVSIDFSDLSKISQPEFETSSYELKLSSKNDCMYIRFNSIYELKDFESLISQKLATERTT